MPTYKQRPKTKKERQVLPFYRPIDRLAAYAIESRRILVPIAMIGALCLAFFGGFKAYSYHYENKASQLLNQNSLEGLVKDYGRSKASKTARVKLGEKAFKAQDYDQALEWYHLVAEDEMAPALLKIAAQQNLALVYFKKREFPKALEWLQKAAGNPQNAGSDYTELLIARVEEVSGNQKRAMEIYQTLAEGANNEAVKREAEERRAWLEEPSP